MYRWYPEFTRNVVQSYVIGRLQYGSALYWLRATKSSIYKVRYDYMQAMASICELTLPEIIGKPSYGRDPVIREDNERYLNLYKYVNLSMIQDLAIRVPVVYSLSGIFLIHTRLSLQRK